MSRIQTAVHNELQLLKLLRDKTQLQAHLLKADLKDRWAELEGKWLKLQGHVDRAEVAAGDACRDADAALAGVMVSLRSGYTHIKEALRS